MDPMELMLYESFAFPNVSYVLQITQPGGPNTTVQAYLADNYDYHYDFIGPVVGILLAFTIFFAGLAIVMLKTNMVHHQVPNQFTAS